MAILSTLLTRLNADSCDYPDLIKREQQQELRSDHSFNKNPIYSRSPGLVSSKMPLPLPES